MVCSPYKYAILLITNYRKKVKLHNRPQVYTWFQIMYQVLNFVK